MCFEFLLQISPKENYYILLCLYDLLSVWVSFWNRALKFSSFLILIMVPLVNYSAVISPVIDLLFLFLIFLGPQKCHYHPHLCSQHCPTQVPWEVWSKIRPNASGILSQSTFLHFVTGYLWFPVLVNLYSCNSACWLSSWEGYFCD